MSDTPPYACKRRWSKRLDRAFVGSLSPRALRALRHHAKDCEDCRRVYDELGRAERGLWGSAFPEPARARVGALLPAAARGRRLWAPAGALAAAAAAFLFWIVSGGAPGPEPEFRPRGHDLDLEALAPGQREPGVRLFCVRVSDDGADIADDVHMTTDTMPAAAVTCRIDDELQIAYSTPSLPGLTMTAAAESPSGELRWYAPPHPGASSVPLAPDVVDEPLAWSTRLGAEHEPGTYDVVARFFIGPVPASPGAGEPVAEVRARLAIEAHSEEPP